MISDEDKKRLKRAVLRGSLTVWSCDTTTGAVRRSPVAATLKHSTEHKRLIKVVTEGGRSAVATEDHSLFLFADGVPQEAKTCDIKIGCLLAVIDSGTLLGDKVVSVVEQESTPETFDLSVPGDENFILSNGILAHNSYSISGVSLDIDKSSKYLALKENFEGQHEKMLDQAKSSIKIVKGLQQPRYGIGISSALGPYSRVGVQSRRNYISGGGSWV